MGAAVVVVLGVVVVEALDLLELVGVFYFKRFLVE
jgi:hypothetical protein